MDRKSLLKIPTILIAVSYWRGESSVKLFGFPLSVLKSREVLCLFLKVFASLDVRIRQLLILQQEILHSSIKTDISSGTLESPSCWSPRSSLLK
ncbi:hypothetical protein HWI79_253 [Cryptosporidium felis]|nr:hypothetical protein HWI79_253 [Cryptosporidium felis]